MRPERLWGHPSGPPELPGAAELLASFPADPDAATRAVLRGRIDGLALRARFSDARLYAGTAPPAGPRRVLFDQFEQGRVEALGAALAGVRANLAARFAREPIAEDAPLLRAARARWGAPLPVDDGSPATSAGLSAAAARKIDAMAASLHDQWAFALQALDLVSLAFEGRAPEPALPRRADAARGAGRTQPAPGIGLQGLSMDSEEDTPSLARRIAAGAADRDAPEPRSAIGPAYRVFTREFDRVIDGEDVRRSRTETHAPEDRQRAALREELVKSRANFARWAHRLQRHLMAQQLRSWQFDLDEGMLDAARLTRLVTDPTQPLSFKRERPEEFPQTAVTLLIDCSGSMRGLPIATAAGCAELLVAVLERCGVQAEILGFTTRQWRGGEARAQWLGAGRPREPGRLNDLLHVIFKRGTTPWRRARHSLEKMLDEELLKENIDGEALLWAHERTLRRAEPRRILMVISDGAPLDDATLAANDPGYLDRHLRTVIAQIEARAKVELLAIGIGHHVGAYYPRSFTVSGPQNLGEAIVTQLIALLGKRERRAARGPPPRHADPEARAVRR
jgi:cobaltochelatase CobT